MSDVFDAVNKNSGEERVVKKGFFRKRLSPSNILLLISVLLIVIYFFANPSVKPSINSEAVLDLGLDDKPQIIEVYYFYENSPDCGRCLEGKAFVEGLKAKYSQIILRTYEVKYDPDNQELLNQFAKEYDVAKPHIIPMTFIEGKYFKDFTNGIGSDMNSYVRNLLV